ncbi:MAG: universal stress protein [Phaeodactylibacter sp.]|nr:universal stress protein [Phaeodactylibacter sp.]MCB9296070.1 universal stress protein [Lewinellaceae bacterium]
MKNILRAVDTQHADLVVMQTHRRTWWRHILEESTTKDIANVEQNSLLMEEQFQTLLEISVPI